MSNPGIIPQFTFPWPCSRIKLFAGILALALAINPFSFADNPAKTPAAVETADWASESTKHLGQWIWDTNCFDKQTCRLWKSFAIPSDAKVTSAILRITVDNGFTLFLDGQEIGRGSDWRSVTTYDVTQIMMPGRHVLAVEGFNDRLQAGLILGLYIQMANHEPIELASDDSWWVVPNTLGHWESRTSVMPDWHRALVIGSMHHHPWERWPLGYTIMPPLRPVSTHFWQKGWFELALVIACLAAFVFCVWLMTLLSAQSSAQEFLQMERARIAMDIHDDVGAQLTQLVLLGEVAQREEEEDSTARRNFMDICERVREISQSMDEVVWAVNSRRDTVRDFTSHVCKHAMLFLGTTSIRCRLDVQPELPEAVFDLHVRRNLFLAVKEALNNAAKYSGATELFLRIHVASQKLVLVVEDNGAGFDPSSASDARNGLANMALRTKEIGGTTEISSQPGGGCRVVFTVPLNRNPATFRFPWRLRARHDPRSINARITWRDDADLTPK